MRTLVVGAMGMLGRAVVDESRRRGNTTLGLGRDQVDLLDEAGLVAAVDHFRPEVVVNCAAFTAVDRCEDEPEKALAINGRGVGNVLAACDGVEAWLMQISTDYVFDGMADSPYAESAQTAPLSVYGRTKLEGERQALMNTSTLVLRTSWLFGPGGGNFVRTLTGMIDRGERRLRVVDDQVGCPTYSPFVARAICDLVELDPRPAGLMHYRNRPAVSWHGFATALAHLWAPDTSVEPVSTTAMPRPAARPPWSVLDVGRFESLLGRKVEAWSAGLAEYLNHLRSERKSL